MLIARRLKIHLQVNAPPAKAGGFGLRLKAGLIGRTADGSLSRNRERAGERVQESTSVLLSPLSPTLSPQGEGRGRKSNIAA